MVSNAIVVYRIVMVLVCVTYRVELPEKSFDGVYELALSHCTAVYYSTRLLCKLLARDYMAASGKLNFFVVDFIMLLT